MMPLRRLVCQVPPPQRFSAVGCTVRPTYRNDYPRADKSWVKAFLAISEEVGLKQGF